MKPTRKEENRVLDALAATHDAPSSEDYASRQPTKAWDALGTAPVTPSTYVWMVVVHDFQLMWDEKLTELIQDIAEFVPLLFATEASALAHAKACRDEYERDMREMWDEDHDPDDKYEPVQWSEIHEGEDSGVHGWEWSTAAPDEGGYSVRVYRVPVLP